MIALRTWSWNYSGPGEASIYGLIPTARGFDGCCATDITVHDEWNGTRIVFRLEAAKSGILLRFSHAGWRSASPYFVSCNTTWGELMFRLKAAAEGKSRGPLFLTAGMA